MSEQILVNKLIVEKLKVWYALFTTIMDETQYTDKQRIDKLNKLHKELEGLIPNV